MILGLLKLWMSSKAPPMDMDPPLPCPMTPTMIYLSMPVLGMTKQKKANIGKRRHAYNTNIDNTYVAHITACIVYVPNSPYGGINIPPDEFTRYIHFPLGTHLLQGLVNPPDLHLGHNLNILGLPNQLEGMMALSSCLPKSISYSSRMQ